MAVLFRILMVKEAIDEKEEEEFEVLDDKQREHLPSNFKTGGCVCSGAHFVYSVQGLNKLKRIEGRNNPSSSESIGDSDLQDYDFGDHEKHAQQIQNEEEINSEILQQTKEEHLEPSDNHHSKSNQEQKLGPSCQASSQGELLSDVPESRMERSNNDEPRISTVGQGNHKLFASISCDSDSLHTWGGSQLDRLDQSNHDKDWETRRLFGKSEYVDGKWKKNRLMELYSCEFTHPHNNQTVYIRKQSPGYLFTFDEDDFVARVSFDKLEELDFAKLSVNIKRDFFKKLIIIEIIRDKSINDRDAAYKKLKQLLHDRSGKTVDNLECAENIFQLSRILESYRNSSKGSILDNIVNNTYISSDFKDTCQQLLNREEALNARRKVFSQFDQFHSKNIFEELHEIYERAVKNHKTSLLDKCSSSTSQLAYSLHSNIDSLSGQQVLCISNKDINLFSDLANEMDELFSKFLNNLQSSLFNKVMEAKNHKSLKELAPLTHPIHFYLCKHFQELILEISGKTHISSKDLLIVDAQERLNLVKTINWPSTSLLNYSLEQQYRFIFKLIQHFEPGYNSKKGKFKYECKLLKSSDKTLLQRVQGWCLGSNTSSDMAEERLVWIYVLDDAIAQLFPEESEKCLELFMPLLEGYRGFIQETEDVHYESFRIVMHNTIRFIAQAIPYLSEEASEIDEVTLTNQIEFIKNAISQKQFIDFRDLVDVYSEYWKNRESLIEKIPDKFPYGKFKKDMERIRQKLFNIVNTVLSKEVTPPELINYFRSYNEFLGDLSAVEFSWFIKKISDSSVEEVKLVNKDKKSYKVLDPENFIKKHENISSHYLIEIIDDLLNIVSNLLGQKEWSDCDNLNAASELVSAIKKSFLYLKEQPNYLSFNTYKEESTKPFACVVENSSSYEDFMKRVGIIRESFWYLRKQDEIDIKKALSLYKKENCNITIETEVTLIHCYYRYLDKFNSYIQRTFGKNYVDKIEFITKEVKDQLELININEWEGNFKKETLPELLAGVAAVWSVQASKDIGSVGKTLKPHCIQVLCILLLLSVDKDKKGVEKHFAQVLTGQGKSLVLCLLSSLLALTGHKVRTVYYSEYLATRDQEDFDNLFMVFGISHKITYGTFDEMADEVLEPMINGKRQFLPELIAGRILNQAFSINTEQLGHLEYEDTSNTILLIDEVDVFFSNQYYGNCYWPCTIIGFPALVGIQEKIWDMACKDYGKSVILKEVEEFIENRIAERNQDFKQFNQFLFKPGKYYLLKNESNVLIKKEYTNRSLYEEHLNTMIDNAIYIATASNNDFIISLYKINDYGIISYRVDNYYCCNTYLMYYNVFNYFRLKRMGYDYKEYNNYGYLNIQCGSISYAKLPKKYPLILGVSGTTLNDHEREAVRNSYSIHENSIMPSCFGDSNLKFDKYCDFISENSEEKWLSKIYDRTNSMIRSGRSVLIFFNTVTKIDKFKNNFCGKFDRLHTLTENTEIQTTQKYIHEAGIAKTVTLATKGMGRGVDFKSSVAVEKKDGVHVIQTFFSLDIKEETQIKGRTARKDNKGSYELIVCKEHLISAKLIDEKETNVSYDSLSQSREKRIKIICSDRETRMKNKENQNQITMEFFESFFFKEYNEKEEVSSANTE